MDRATQLFLMSALVDRVRLYPSAAFNQLFEALEIIERQHDLIPQLSEAEEVEVDRLEVKIERGERIPELELSGPIEDLLPEPESSIMARLAALPEDERDTIWDLVRQLVDIDEPPFRESPAMIASVRATLKEIDAGKTGKSS